MKTQKGGKRFDVSQYIAQLSIDCVIFGYEDQSLKVLVSSFTYGEALWGLPGGYVMKQEGIDEAAARILEERTSLSGIFLEQFRVFGSGHRIVHSTHRRSIRAALRKFDPAFFDPEVIDWITGRFVCIGYYALVDIRQVRPRPGMFEKALEWRALDELPELTHDHHQIIQEGLEALRQDLDRKLIGFRLLPDIFTMRDVQELYEAVYGREFARNNFQKKMLDLGVLERLNKKYSGGAHKAPYQYRFRS